MNTSFISIKNVRMCDMLALEELSQQLLAYGKKLNEMGNSL